MSAWSETLYEDSIKLIEMPDLGNISVCVYNEHDGLFAMSERINARFEQAYMNGYNWDALIRYYVEQKDAQLMSEIETDPEAGSFAAYMPHAAGNLEKMQQFEAYIREMVSDEDKLLKFIDDHVDDIEWD